MITRLFCFGLVLGLLTTAILVSSTSYALDSAAEEGYKKGIGQTNLLNNTKQGCIDAGGKFVDKADDTKDRCVDKATGDPFTGDSVGKSIQNIINILLYIAGVIAVIYVVIAGYRYVFSNGDSGSITKAKNTLIYALVGLAMAILAYAIVNFILDNIVQV